MLLTLMTLPMPATGDSGNATVEWIAISATTGASEPLPTGIRMVVDPGWHTYWSNPGEAGMKPVVEWRLPRGWSAGELLFPVPERFDAGGIAGFGYKGTVVFPVVVTPPPDFEGSARLKAKISWLTCDDNACVPGDAEILLELTAGEPVAGPDSPAVRDALMKIPFPPESGRIRLGVTEKEPDLLEMEIVADDNESFDPGLCEVFPVTPHVIDPAQEIRFTRVGGKWIATARKSGFARTPVNQLALVLAGEGAAMPAELTWNASTE